MARERGPQAQVMLAKPLTFMNRSGQAVGALSRYFRIEPDDILIVVDDANLPLGRLRARLEGSDGGHNGLRSIIDVLASRKFSRLRLGVGLSTSHRELADHVLARFDADEMGTVNEMIGRAADAVDLFVDNGMSMVMNRFNAFERPDDAAGADSIDSNDPVGGRDDRK